MKPSTIAFVAILLVPSFASAASIGVNFTGGRSGGTGAGTPTALLPTEVAGLVPQTNFNNINGGSGTNIALSDEAGVATTATVTYTGSGTWTAVGGSTLPAGGNEKLNNGFVFGMTTVNITGIPYDIYDLYIYTLNDAVRSESVALLSPQSSTVYLTSPAPNGAAYIDGDAGTPYTYIEATSTVAGSPTNPANYVKFSSLTGPDASFQTNTTTSNAFVNGFQIVQVPEPSGAMLAIVGLAGMCLRRRR